MIPVSEEYLKELRLKLGEAYDAGDVGRAAVIFMELDILSNTLETREA